MNQKLNNPLAKTKKEKKERLQIKRQEKDIEIKLSSIQQKLDDIQNTKNKLEIKLTKDKHYYNQNKAILRKKARIKYHQKMKDRKYRFEYLAKQRDYNRRRKKKDKYKCLEKYNLLYPYNPFKDVSPILIIFEGD